MKVKIIALLLASLQLLIARSSAQSALFQGCDNEYNVNPGYSYLESPYYPNYYPTGTSCRYKFVAPYDYDIQVNCTINLDKAQSSCSTEYFYVATDGDKQLRGSEQFCGYGNLVRTSLFRSIVLAYVSYGSTGQFRCQLHVKPRTCDCGWSVNTRIVNGQQAATNEYPSMVALRDKTSGLQSFCAGAIIARRFILTAAHCTRLQPVASNIVALVGDHDLTSSSETRYAAEYSIAQIIEHAGYTEDPVTNDIALLRTATPIEWSRGVGPICLPPYSSASNSFAYSYVDVVGWGTTSFAGPTSPTLQKVQLLVAENANCQQAYSGIATISSSQLCTYDYSGNSRDSCQYDSGGPVILRQARQFLLGCISFGKICGQGGYAMGVNTRITSYLSWIYQNTGYSTCQVATCEGQGGEVNHLGNCQLRP